MTTLHDITDYILCLQCGVEEKLFNALLIAIGLAVLVSVVPNLLTLVRGLLDVIVSPAWRLARLDARETDVRDGALLAGLKREVELLAELSACMDAFTHARTRLVLSVDGLETCEQDKLLLVLDHLRQLFSEPNSPFIMLLAVDPHVVIKGIESNLQVRPARPSSCSSRSTHTSSSRESFSDP